MAQPLAIVAGIAIVLIVGYVVYTVFLSHMPLPSHVITSPQSNTNTVTNSIISGNTISAKSANIIKIYERDYEGSQVNFSIIPRNVIIIRGTNISFYIMNQGQIPHGLNITGPVNSNGILLNTTMVNANGIIVNTSIVIVNIGLGNIILPGANVFFNFTAPAIGNYTIFSPVAGQEALGLKANLKVVNQT